MIDSFLSVSVASSCQEPFEDRIDILFRELELATKWQRPSVLLAIYSSDYVRADADIALENRLHDLGQSAYHIKVKNQEGADVSLQISELANLNNVVFFVEGLRWGSCGDNCYSYETLNNHREFFIENQIRVVFWLTEKEAIDLAHFAPDYWCFRHRVIEFVDSPQPAQIAPDVLETAWQDSAEVSDSNQDLDARIALRTALLTDLPDGNESTAARANLLLTLGVLHWRRREFERAIHYLNTALDLAARLEDAGFEALCFNAIALVDTDLDRLEEAIQAYQNAISLAPDRITTWNNLGQLYRKLGRRDEALAAFQKAIEQNGSDALGWNGLGELYAETGSTDESVYAYLKATEFAPDLARSWSGLGKSYKQSGRLNEALAAYQKAIQIDRRSVESWLGLADICKNRGNNKYASMAYRTILKLDPENHVAWTEVGNLYYSAGIYDRAMRAYLKSIASDQCGYLPYSNLASIYAHKGLHTQAIPLLVKAIELSQNSAETVCLWKRLGDAYRSTDDYDNAVEAYREADSFSLRGHASTLSAGSTPPAEEPPILFEEQVPENSQSQVENCSVKKEPVPTEVARPIFFQIPAEDANSAQPDPEFVNWLDGLASVLPVNPQSKPAIQPEPAEKADVLIDELSLHQPQGQTAQAAPDRRVISYVPFEEYTAGAAIKKEVPYQIEEREVVMLNEDRNKTSLGEMVAQAGPTSQPEQSEGVESLLTQASIGQKNALIWNELGNIYYNAGAFEEALHAFEMAIELDPTYGWSYNNLASIYFHQKRYAEAIPLYQKGLQYLDDLKDKALLWNRLGDAYRRLDDHDQAAAAYRKAIELDSNNVSLLARARFSLLGNLRA
jgi:tetratricopeptide (TPR) repeat protein